MKKVLKVKGMSCSHCEKAVKDSLKKLREVQDVTVDLISGKVEVEGSELVDSKLKEAVDEAGYDVVEIQ